MNQNNIKPQELRATDLRIGNLVYYKNTKDIAKVELIHNKHFDCRDEYGNFTPNGNYEPIPLSEEVLLKAGFKHKGAGFYIHASSLLDLCNIGDDFFLVGLKGVSLSKVYYLHQLQNLYYSLTGEELEVLWT
ncbi:hypothetical protein [Sphingobacterium kyonggiense]